MLYCEYCRVTKNLPKTEVVFGWCPECKTNCFCYTTEAKVITQPIQHISEEDEDANLKRLLNDTNLIMLMQLC